MKNVTIITPYYKGKKTIFKTIDSVFKSAEREKKIKINYIVVIDSMEDKELISKSLEKKYGDKIIIIKNDTNIGVADSRNKALEFTKFKFDYVLFLDQDDLIREDYFEKMSQGIEENADIIVSNAYVVNLKNNKKVKMYYIKPNLSFESFLKGNKILTPGQVMFSKKVAQIKDLFKGCSVEFKGADDWASYLNIFVKYNDVNIKYIKYPIFYYNLHDNNYSKKWKELNMSAIRTAEYFIDKVDSKRRKILKKQIDFLEFENRYKDKNYKYSINDLDKIVSYKCYNIFSLNKIVHFLNKKFIKFNN